MNKMRSTLVIAATALIIYFAITPGINQLKEDLEVANLIIVATQAERDRAMQYAEALENELASACEAQPAQPYRGPYIYPQRYQEDTPPVSC